MWSLFLPERDYVTSRSLLSQNICRLSSVCLSSVWNVRAPYSGGWNFRHYFSPFCTLATRWPPCKILRRSSQGNPSVGAVKRKRGSKIERYHVRVSHLLMTCFDLYFTVTLQIMLHLNTVTSSNISFLSIPPPPLELYCFGLSDVLTCVRHESSWTRCSEAQALRFPKYQISWLSEWLGDLVRDFFRGLAQQWRPGKKRNLVQRLSLIHIWRCRRIERCRSRWSPYH